MSDPWYVSAAEAVGGVKSGDRVFIHGSAATPTPLVAALQARGPQLRDVELVSITHMSDVDFDRPELAESFFVNSLFVSEPTRAVVNSDHGDYLPVFLSEIPQLFRRRILPIDVALIQVSPPDAHGFCSLGTSVDIAKAAVEVAAQVVALVNPRMPRTHGDGYVHVDRLAAMVWHEAELPELNYSSKSTAAIEQIGRNVAELVDDGATLQMGIGSIPDQVLVNLVNHAHLGIHTEMLSDGLLPLLESGVVDNSRKRLNPGISVTGFLAGTRRLYDFVDDNPSVQVLDIAYVNDTANIRQNPNVTAINSAIEIDLTGQVCADSIGTYQYSGIGGQMDFMRGASLSPGGKPIIALPSTTTKGVSRIVPFLRQGAGVVTTRGHVHWVVTEFGAVDLFGKNLKQRGMALIELAHPMHREELERAFAERYRAG